MKKNPIKLLKFDKKIMNILKNIIRELDQHFKLANLFENRQYLNCKNIKSAHANTQQPFNQSK